MTKIDTSTIVLIILFILAFYIAPVVYLTLYTYSEYATSITNSWKRYLIIAPIPIVNLAVIAHMMTDIIWFEFNPLEDAFSVRRRLNSKVKCEKCGANSHTWQAVSGVDAYGDYTYQCSYCESGTSNLKDASQSSPVIKGHEMTLREAVQFKRSAMKLHQDNKAKKLDNEYAEQERIIYGTR